mgnify:CR=1 FL=1
MNAKKAAAIALLPDLNLKADFFTLNSDTVNLLAETARAVGRWRKGARD